MKTNIKNICRFSGNAEVRPQSLLTLAFLVGITLAISGSGGAHIGNNIIDKMDFETGDFSQADGLLPCGDMTAQSNCKNSITIVKSPVRWGRYAARTYIDRTHERSEIRAKGVEKGGTYWYGWSLYVPVKNGVVTGVVNQFHKYWPEIDQPKWEWAKGKPTTLDIENGKWVFRVLYQPNPSVKSTSKVSTVVGTVEKGRWTNWVMHAKWSFQSDGFIKLWKDGKLVYTR